jgi:hypothetical protein
MLISSPDLTEHFPDTHRVLFVARHVTMISIRSGHHDGTRMPRVSDSCR